jgi:hypothetical protein
LSHLAQRKETNCLNCGTQVIGRYCHDCGQENIEPKESVWHLISHFFQDITHFDGKFFTSLKDLIFKPGFLSREYMLGRRARYLHPIRMYLFTSAIFFLIFFSLYKIDEKSIKIGSTLMGLSYDDISKMDSAKLSEFTKKINDGKPLTLKEVKERMGNSTFNIAPSKYRSRKEYDSVLRTGTKKHNWFERQLVYKDIEFKEKYNSDGKVIMAALLNSFMHSLPQMLFVLLPLFALILKLVYVRRKQFYYVDHIIFTIHLYIFIFLVMLVTFGLGKLRTTLHWQWLRYLAVVLVLAIFYYFYKALRNFYQQRRAKTILKYFILLFLFLVTTSVMFVLFFFFQIFAI